MNALLEQDAMETSTSGLAKVSQLVNRVDILRNEIAGTEALLASQQEELQRILRESLPEALSEARIPSITTEQGRVITKEQIVSGTWPKEEQAVRKAVEWLEKERLTDLIKTSIVVEFDKGDREAAAQLYDKIRESRFANAFKSLTLKESVHHQTLNAMFRERLAQGKETPIELFNGFVAWVAKIAEPKKRSK